MQKRLPDPDQSEPDRDCRDGFRSHKINNIAISGFTLYRTNPHNEPHQKKKHQKRQIKRSPMKLWIFPMMSRLA